MAYTKQQLDYLTDNSLLFNNKLVIADINLFNNVYDFNLSDFNKSLIEDVLKMYFDYLKILNQYSSSYLKNILKTLKLSEIIDNHSNQSENIDLLKKYMEFNNGYTIDYLLNNSESNNLDNNILLKSHEILMQGTNNSNFTTGFRNNNNAFVRFLDNNGNNVIRYFPLAYDEIPKVLPLLYEYYNKPSDNLEDIFIVPLIVHLLIASFQFFNDGNTRLARTISQVKIFQLTNALTEYKLMSPALYYSKQLIPYIDQYRDLIYNFVLNPNNDNINNWLKFNLYRIMDQLYYYENNMALIRK